MRWYICMTEIHLLYTRILNPQILSLLEIINESNWLIWAFLKSYISRNKRDLLTGLVLQDISRLNKSNATHLQRRVISGNLDALSSNYVLDYNPSKVIITMVQFIKLSKARIHWTTCLRVERIDASLLKNMWCSKIFWVCASSKMLKKDQQQCVFLYIHFSNILLSQPISWLKVKKVLFAWGPLRTENYPCWCRNR